MKRILVIRFGSLGDVILTSPTILNLKISYPESRLTFLTKERFRQIVERFDGVDDVITLQSNTGLRNLSKLLVKLGREHFDIVVDLHGNPRSWLVRKILAAPQTVVYPKRRWERRQAIDSENLPKTWPHTIDLYNDCLRQLDGLSPAMNPVLIPPELETDNSEIYRKLNSNNQWILIAPGAAHPTKQWPLERFAEVSEELHDKYGANIIWAISSFDNVSTSYIGSLGSDAVIELVDLPIEKLASIIAHCRLTIANDSGIAHLSSAVGTPVIALFGPTHPVLGFSPAGLHDKVLDVDEPCRPCSLHGDKPCHRDKRYCFERLTVDRVTQAATNILNSDINNMPALFIDRDGTLIVDKGYLKDPDGIQFEEGAIEALKKARSLGFKIIIVSNQSGVARGFFSINNVEQVNRRLLEMLSREDIDLDGLYYCPHYPNGTVSLYSKVCQCRKPAAGMLHKAAIELGIDIRKSWVIGDKIDDVNLGKVAGARSVLVRTGHGQEQEQRFIPSRFTDRTLVADNLRAAVELIRKDINYD
ncbi:MAG: D-glycero-beta-D-manno-heptose 1,7-bisphosphate 7-phosphatase [candidate division Zixibacteria bacterium]|nr:D-glycero-beta-D-manno-heptose 1,7-bisphosphate 7-phosphatase [candidate division Zixibacteria bacterium]